MNRDAFYVAHVLECIAKILRYTSDGEPAFMTDERTQDAVVRNLQVLAESTQRISAERKSMHPEVEWKTISGFRNVLVHNYLGLDVEEVWKIVETDLPALQAKMQLMESEIRRIDI